jgi:antibiotic biosynthesis monooxygenase (ABM) superfamily enzyme
MSRERAQPPADRPLGPIRRGIAQLAFYLVASVGAYGALNLLLLLAQPLVRGWPIAATTAIIVPPMVAVMIHAVVPLALRAKARILAQG